MARISTRRWTMTAALLLAVGSLIATACGDDEKASDDATTTSGDTTTTADDASTTTAGDEIVTGEAACTEAAIKEALPDATSINSFECADGWAGGSMSNAEADSNFVLEAEGQFWIAKSCDDAGIPAKIQAVACESS